MSRRLYEKYKGATVMTHDNECGVVCGHRDNTRSSKKEDADTLVVAVMDRNAGLRPTNEDIILIPCFENWEYGYRHVSEKNVLVKRRPHVININLLFNIYEGFSFKRRGADFVGTKGNKIIFIEDAGCLATNWLVHEYDDYDSEKEIKTFEGRVWL